MSRRTLAAMIAAIPVVLAAGARPLAGAPQSQPTGSLDALMARVLEHRDEGWKKLHDYVLSETERYDLTGPGGVRLDGMRRDFAWYVRDGYLIRSPLRFDGVTISEAERRKYEDNWLHQEQTRAEGRRREQARRAGQSEPSLQDLMEQRGEPRFITEAFFLKFKFEAGNYYLAGREQVDGRNVLRIEYYPQNLWGSRRRGGALGGTPHNETERRLERDLNKVSLVTLWVDPAEYQVVRYKFDNVDFGFLPARWLVRVDTITATMTMSRVLDGVWLPHEMRAQARLTLANGSYDLQYGRDLYDYKKAETSAKIRDYRDREP